MSGQSSGEKTEQPTAKKLRDSRKKGQVAKSKEVVSASLLTGLFVTLWVMSDYFVSRFSRMMLAPANHITYPFRIALETLLNEVMLTFVQILAPILLIVFIFGIGANFVQIGALFTVEPIIPKFEKLNPMKALKNIFSMKNLFELVKSVVKITVLSILIGWVIMGGIDDLLKAPSCGLTCLISVFASLMKQIIIVTIIAFVIIAAFDLFFQRWQYTKNLMMTKDEVKREYKEMEGSPEIKGKRKQFHRELMEGQGGGQSQKAKESSVLVTNPLSLCNRPLLSQKIRPYSLCKCQR
jgi:type III secretion protein U